MFPFISGKHARGIKQSAALPATQMMELCFLVTHPRKVSASNGRASAVYKKGRSGNKTIDLGVGQVDLVPAEMPLDPIPNDVKVQHLGID